MPWKRMLAYITGSVNEDLLRRIEYLLEENRVLRNQIDCRILLTDNERGILAEKAIALGKLMADTVTIVKPETILKWHRRLVAKKFDGSRFCKRHGRPPTKAKIEDLVIRLARDNPAWGYDRIAGAVHNLGHHISDQTVGNILQRNGLGSSAERRRNTTWSDFIRRHREVLWATDFFTTEIWTSCGLTTYYVLFFIHVRTRRIVLGGMSQNPNEPWVKQICQECDRVGGGTCRSRLSDSRPRLQIHPVLRWDSERRRYRGRETSAADPEPECVCGAVREDHQDRMRGAVRPVRRRLLRACDPGVLGALSRRMQSSGNRQCHSVSRRSPIPTRRGCGKGRATRGIAQLLPPSSRLTNLIRGWRASSVASRSRWLMSCRDGL